MLKNLMGHRSSQIDTDYLSPRAVAAFALKTVRGELFFLYTVHLHFSIRNTSETDDIGGGIRFHLEAAEQRYFLF